MTVTLLGGPYDGQAYTQYPPSAEIQIVSGVEQVDGVCHVRWAIYHVWLGTGHFFQEVTRPLTFGGRDFGSISELFGDPDDED